MTDRIIRRKFAETLPTPQPDNTKLYAKLHGAWSAWDKAHKFKDGDFVTTGKLHYFLGDVVPGRCGRGMAWNSGGSKKRDTKSRGARRKKEEEDDDISLSDVTIDTWSDALNSLEALQPGVGELAPNPQYRSRKREAPAHDETPPVKKTEFPSRPPLQGSVPVYQCDAFDEFVSRYRTEAKEPRSELMECVVPELVDAINAQPDFYSQRLEARDESQKKTSEMLEEVQSNSAQLRMASEQMYMNIKQMQMNSKQIQMQMDMMLDRLGPMDTEVNARMDRVEATAANLTGQFHQAFGSVPPFVPLPGVSPSLPSASTLPSTSPPQTIPTDPALTTIPELPPPHASQQSNCSLPSTHAFFSAESVPDLWQACDSRGSEPAAKDINVK